MSSQQYSFKVSLALSVLAAASFWNTALAQAPIVPDAAYQQSFEKWKAVLIDDLKKNWLPLAGLFWLKPGENTFGSGSRNSIVFPKGPAEAGTFTLQGKDVELRLASGVQATIAGKPFTQVKLLSDASGSPTHVDMGRLNFHVIVRGARTGIRLIDIESDSVRTYSGPKFFPLDMQYRVTATWLSSDGKRTVDVPNVLGDVNTYPAPGTVVLKIKGEEVRLTALSGDPAKGFFLVFNDTTSKSETYPSGRFLDTGPVVDGKVEIDFNRAYNPPCAVTPYATCPLAPKENRLALAIPAGQKYDHAQRHH